MAESESSNIEGHGSARKTRWFRWSIFTFILILVGAWGFQTLKTYWFYVHETDARIVADMISISSQVSGRILERPVDMGSQVQRGDLLAVIDGREVSLKVEQLTAQLSRNDARQEEVLAKVAMTEERIAAQNVLHMGKLKTAEASLQFVEYDVSFYENELQHFCIFYLEYVLITSSFLHILPRICAHFGNKILNSRTPNCDYGPTAAIRSKSI